MKGRKLSKKGEKEIDDETERERGKNRGEKKEWKMNY